MRSTTTYEVHSKIGQCLLSDVNIVLNLVSILYLTVDNDARNGRIKTECRIISKGEADKNANEYIDPLIKYVLNYKTTLHIQTLT